MPDSGPMRPMETEKDPNETQEAGPERNRIRHTWTDLRERIETARQQVHTMERETGGRVPAYIGTALGGGLSIWANVQYTFIRPPGVTGNWTPEIGSIVFSVFWPVCTFILLEIISKAVVLKGWRHAWIRYGSLIPIGFVSAVVSYVHISALLRHYHNEPIVCAIGPLAVDGLMVLSAFVVYLTGRAAQTPKRTGSRVSSPRVAKETQTPSRIQGRLASTMSQVTTGSPNLETQTQPVETQAQATISSLAERSQTQINHLDAIKSHAPDWLARGGKVSYEEIAEATRITGKGSLAKLRAAMIAEAESLQVPDDARELVTTGS